MAVKKTWKMCPVCGKRVYKKIFRFSRSHYEIVYSCYRRGQIEYLENKEVGGPKWGKK